MRRSSDAAGCRLRTIRRAFRFPSLKSPAALLFVAAAWPALPQAPAQVRDAGRLELHRSVERELGPGHSDVFTVKASTGQFMHVIADKHGVDITIVLSDPHGKELVTANIRGAFGLEPASWIAAEDGAYRIRISKSPRTSESGRYRIELTDLRLPSAQDRTRLEAETEFYAAVAADRQEDKPHRLQAAGGYERALSLWHSLGDRAAEASCLEALGTIYSDLGQGEKALGYYNQALPLWRAVGDRADEAEALDNIGEVFADLGQWRKALDDYNQALPLRRAVGDRAGEAQTLQMTGIVYNRFGQQQRALDYYNQALPLRRAVGDLSGEAWTLRSIGTAYGDLGDTATALSYYNQALPLWRAAKYRTGEAGELINIAEANASLGEKQKALDYLKQALPLLRMVGDPLGESLTLADIGDVYGDLGEKQTALDYYRQALTIQRAQGYEADQAATLTGMGIAYAAMGQQENALGYYQDALPLRHTVGDRSGEAETLHDLHDLLKGPHPDLAIFLGKLSVNILQSIRRDNQGLNGELQRTYETSIVGYYRSLAGDLVERGRFGETEEVLTLLKDKEASDIIRRDPVTDQLRPATLLDPEKRAFDRYQEIVRDPQASAAFARFLDEEEKALGSSVARPPAEIKEAAGLEETLRKLGPDVAAIYTLVAPDRYVAMLVTASGGKAYTTPIRETDLNKKIFDFRLKLQDPSSDPVPAARELYAIVFPEGLREDLDRMHVRTIMWSIDNTLRYLPIAALHDGKDYLVKSFRNSLITPASLAHLTDQPSPKWQGVGFGVSNASPPLPAVPLELESIFRKNTSDAGAIPGTIRLNADFTRAHFESDLKRSRPDVVHIATHFDSRPGVAANSHLVMGDGDMTLAEIEAQAGLFQGVELLTLSACNTAFTNSNQDGREVDSFGTIAQRLGAKAVIASLWSVNDPATARFMAAFYRLREQQGITKAEALQRAQEEMLGGRLTSRGGTDAERGVRVVSARTTAGWSHPFYWAPFILIGNWK